MHLNKCFSVLCNVLFYFAKSMHICLMKLCRNNVKFSEKAMFSSRVKISHLKKNTSS